eukprot:GILI01029544.1.p1 GENE.GILI01029544.1~~GILI01029544.1.p1  ORF type:complete len:206 (-),score=76.04 GILI01029544.1:39-656(-)
MATATASRNVITLRGSTEIVTEFFGYAVNSILYQRGIYPPESFVAVSKYGLSMLVTKQDELKDYLSNVLSQLSDWLLRGQVKSLVLVIMGVNSGQTLERWTFNVETDRSVGDGHPGVEKSQKEITTEIQAIIRQITASVTFLPLLEEDCTFDLLVYTNNSASVPTQWEESDPKYITKGQQEVKLRSFTTKVHKIDAMVAYQAHDD